MEYRSRIITLLLTFTVILTGCKEVDFTGIVLPEESANDRFTDSKKWNDLNPFREIVVPADNYFILAASDIHAGTTTNLDKFISIAKKADVTAVVMAGDLTWGREEDYKVFQQHLPVQDSLLTFLIAGNHDINFDGWNHFRSRFGTSTYLFKIVTPVATDLYICLENGGATLGKKQFDWLKEVLTTQRQFCRRCIIIMHTNFFRFKFSEASNPQTEEIIAMLDLIVRYKIDMVIAGHDHRQDEVKFGSTTYIVMPPLKDEHPNAGYFRLDIRGSKTEYQFISL